MKAWPFLFAAVLAGCAHAPAPDAITRIVLSRNACDPRCTFAQYVIYPNGRVQYTNGLGYTAQAGMTLQTYRALANYLVQIPAFGPRAQYGDSASQQPATTIWTDFGKQHAQVSFPTQGVLESSDPNVRKLEKWARLATGEARGAIWRAEQKTIARRRRLNDLRRVVFVSGGCLGTCPSYAAVYASNGTALLRNARFVFGGTAAHPVNARASISFEKVEALLAASGFAELQPEYPLRVEDMPGASFEFTYRDGYSYTVRAPDETQWPPEVASLAGGFAQLVRDTEWTPAR